MDPNLIKGLIDFPKPKNKNELMHFPGMINFVARHLDYRMQILEPKNSLLKKDVHFLWDKPNQKS